MICKANSQIWMKKNRVVNRLSFMVMVGWFSIYPYDPPRVISGLCSALLPGNLHNLIAYRNGSLGTPQAHRIIPPNTTHLPLLTMQSHNVSNNTFSPGSALEIRLCYFLLQYCSCMHKRKWFYVPDGMAE